MITVLGSINIDLVAEASRLPVPGETVAGNAFSIVAGGKGANQALAARRAGQQVRLVGALGTDVFAGPAIALLHDADVDVSLVRSIGGPTGTAVIFVAEDGENMITVVPGANGHVNGQDVDACLEEMTSRDI